MRPDNIQSTTELPNYINIGEPTGNIVISGTSADGTTQNFSVTVPTSSNNTRCDIYGSNNGVKQLLSTSNFISNDVSPGGGIYQHISTEIVQPSFSQTSGSVTVTISVTNNSGASITLVTQTVQITVVEYQIPY